MAFLSGGLAVVVLFGFLFGIAYLAKKQNAAAAAIYQADAAQRERRARELGWRYDGTFAGDIRYRFFGSTPRGQDWELRFDSDASSSSSQPKLIWEITSLKSGRTEFQISHGKKFEDLQDPSARKVLLFAARLAGGFKLDSVNDAIAFMQEARVQPLGSGRFRQHLKLIARTPGEVANLLDDECERLLLNWPRTVEPKFDAFQAVGIERDRAGLRIECRYDGTDMPLCEHIVKLGEALAARI
jgi:hypothetical protein